MNFLINSQMPGKTQSFALFHPKKITNASIFPATPIKMSKTCFLSSVFTIPVESHLLFCAWSANLNKYIYLLYLLIFDVGVLFDIPIYSHWKHRLAFRQQNFLWYAIIFLCVVSLYLGKVFFGFNIFFACFTLSQHKMMFFFVNEFITFVCKFYYLS